MQDEEKTRRCQNTETRYDAETDMLDCKVYTCWVRLCTDCPFFTGWRDVLVKETRDDV